MEKKVKVKLIYGDYCENICSTEACFVREKQGKIYDAVLVKGKKDGHGNGECRYWSNAHRPKTTHVVITTEDGTSHTLGPIRYEIVKDIIDKKKSAPKKATPRLNKKDFNNQLKDLI